MDDIKVNVIRLKLSNAFPNSSFWVVVLCAPQLGHYINIFSLHALVESIFKSIADEFLILVYVGTV
jgi:hypothetical protein